MKDRGLLLVLFELGVIGLAAEKLAGLISLSTILMSTPIGWLDSNMAVESKVNCSEASTMRS